MNVIKCTGLVLSLSIFAATFAFAGGTITPLTSVKTPLPVASDATSLDYNPPEGAMHFDSPSNFKDLAKFYAEQLKALGFTADDPMTETDNQLTVKYTKNDQYVVVDSTSSGGSSYVSVAGSYLENKGEKINMPLVKADAAATPAPAAGAKPQLPMPDDADGVQYEAEAGSLQFTSGKSVKELADFYRAEAKKLGLSEQASVINKENMSVLTFLKGDEDALIITVMAMGGKSEVTVEGSLLEGKAAAQVDAASTGAPSAAPPLVAVDKDGLPIPDGLGNTGTSSTQFSHSVNFSAPNGVADIVAFYRAELANKGWKEDAAKVSAEEAELSFATPEGPAKLSVKRNGDMSDAELTVNNKAAAASSPLAPKPGMVKLVFGNMTDKPAVITIGGKKVKLAAKQGSAGPDGPTLDVAPGAMTATIKGAKESFTAGPDEIWMVGVGPGGLIAVKQ